MQEFTQQDLKKKKIEGKIMYVCMYVFVCTHIHVETERKRDRSILHSLKKFLEIKSWFKILKFKGKKVREWPALKFSLDTYCFLTFPKVQLGDLLSFLPGLFDENLTVEDRLRLSEIFPIQHDHVNFSREIQEEIDVQTIGFEIFILILYIRKWFFFITLPVWHVSALLRVQFKSLLFWGNTLPLSVCNSRFCLF